MGRDASATEVACVGGDSFVWGTDLLTDVAVNAPLHGATVALHDIDRAGVHPEMLEAATAYPPRFR